MCLIVLQKHVLNCCTVAVYNTACVYVLVTNAYNSTSQSTYVVSVHHNITVLLQCYDS